MRSKLKWIGCGLLAAALGSAQAAEFNLVAAPFIKTLPDETRITMWGYALDDGVSAPSVPGPKLVVPPGDSTLTVRLRNALAVPTSLVIPGQRVVPQPVMFTDGKGRQRVRSFTLETQPGDTGVYTWSNLDPGTYLYHSGSHPQVQVQMGLYGALTHDAAAGRAYAADAARPDTSYRSELVLLYSEIDPALHEAVAPVTPPEESVPRQPTYGTAAYPSTVNYAPRYFLVNGQPYQQGDAPLPAGAVGERALVRLLNAGLKTHVPMLLGQHLSLVAEDGKPYPHARRQYSVMLPALKTVDAILTPSGGGTFALYDRRLDLTDGGYPDSGMISFLTVASGSAEAPVAVADAYEVAEDAVLAVAAPGVMANDAPAGSSAALVTGPANGTVTLAADGSFSYTPKPDFAGQDGFSYQVSDGMRSSAAASVALTVTPVNDAPAALGESYKIVTNGTLTVAPRGVLANDTDADGDSLTASLVTGLTGLTLNGDGSFAYRAPATAGTYRFTYQARDGAGAVSNPATVTLSVTANKAPVTVAETRTTTRNTALTIAVLANDYDPDTAADPGNAIAPATVRLGTSNLLTVRTQMGGSATVDTSNGTVRYTPRLNFRGTDAFSYNVRDTYNALSNRSTVRINVK